MKNKYLDRESNKVNMRKKTNVKSRVLKRMISERKREALREYEMGERYKI